ncbi:MAG: LytR C-terminal domain-containing protein [Pseudonocardia sp.]
MSEPRPGDNLALKYAGYGLLVIAVIAAVAGLISLASGNSNADPVLTDPDAIPASTEALPAPAPLVPEPAPAAPAPGMPGGPPAAGDPLAAPANPAPPNPGPATAAPVAPSLPGAGLPSDEGTRSGGGKMGGSSAKAPVRVYNNSLVKGLAERAAEDMRDAGWRVDEVGNYADGNIPTSTVYYRAGTSEQAAARSLADGFGLRSAPRFDGLADASPGLIVIVTKDYQRR